MNDRFEICHPITAKWEGGWSDHAADPGGKTMYGVTEAVYHRWLKSKRKKQKPVRQISKAEALAIYKELYWAPTAGKYNLFPGVDLAVYDASVNSGNGRGLKWLKAASGSADHTVTVRRICRARLSFMQALKIWKTFGRGWSRRVADIEVKGVAMALQKMAVLTSKKPAERAEQALKEVARNEVKNADSEIKAKNTVAGGTGAAGSGGTGAVIANPAPLDSLVSWLVAGGVLVAIVIVIALVLQARAASDRKAAYQEATT